MTPVPPVRTICAGALRLEPLVAAHAAEMFVVLSDPAIYEFENEPPSSQDALAARYARLEGRSSPDGTQQWLNWIVRLPNGELAGYVQATVLEGGSAYVAYELASRHWRRGIGTSSLGAVLEELGRSFGVREAFAVLKEANYRSRGLLSKLGFALLPASRRAPWQPDPDEIVMHRLLGGRDCAP